MGSIIHQCIIATLKFIYSEKATKLCKISTVYLSYMVTVKSTVEIWQNFVAFSEYMNFIIPYVQKSTWSVIGLVEKGTFVASNDFEWVYLNDPLDHLGLIWYHSES
jgi:hypothetical protein